MTANRGPQTTKSNRQRNVLLLMAGTLCLFGVAFVLFSPSAPATASTTSTTISSSTATVTGNGPRLRPSNSPKPTPSSSPKAHPKMSEAKVPSKLVPKDNGCQVACPAEDDKLYIITPYRNRAAAYNRFTRTLVRDVIHDSNPFNPNCICLVLVNYKDTPFGPSAEDALSDWPFGRRIVPVSGPFSRAGGLDKGMASITTPKDKSISFFMDADMVVFPGMLKDVRHWTRLNKFFYVPIVWSTWGNPGDVMDGIWRTSGSGMISFYMTDYDTAGGYMPMANKTTYGAEDSRFLLHMQHHSKTQPLHRCSPMLWHLFHMKAAGWGTSVDGLRHDGDDMNKKTWKLPLPFADGPEELESRGKLVHQRCTKAEAGFRYNGKDDMSKRPLFGAVFNG